MRGERLAAAGVALAAALFLLPGVFFGLPTGKFVLGAQRILDGSVPYRDFWTMYAPGSFYLVAALFSLFGQHLIIQGLTVVLVRAASTGAFFLLLSRVGAPRALALAAAAVFAAMFWETAPELTSYPPALFLLLLGVGRMLRGAHFSAGLLCGFAAWFKHDVAAYATCACIASLWLVRALAPAGASRPWPLAATARLVVGALLPVVPVAGALAAVAGPEATQNLLVFPATVFAKVRSEGYPPLVPRFLGPLAAWLSEPGDLAEGSRVLESAGTWIVCHLPEAVFLTGWAVVLRRRKSLPPALLAAAVLFLCFLPFFWNAAHVQRNTHPGSMAVFSMLLGAMAWRGASRRGRAALLAVAVTYVAGLAVFPAERAVRMVRELPGARALNLPGAAGIRVPAAEAAVYGPVTRFLRAHVPEGEPVYVGVARHDAIVITDLRFYYLSRRRGPTRWYELHPGVTDDVRVQEEMIRSIDEQGVRCAVLWRFGWPDALLDRLRDRRRDAVPGLGATALDEHLARAFQPLARVGEFDVLWRRGHPDPPVWSPEQPRPPEEEP